MQSYIKIYSKKNPKLIMRAYPGHFVTPRNHVNYYLDIIPMISRVSEAKAVAEAFSSFYYGVTAVDTIICMDGMEVVGAYLADDLTKAGVISRNMHKTMYVLSPESSQDGQLIFRRNVQGWIRDKNVLLLAARATSGATVSGAVNTLLSYGAKIVGVSALFSTVTKLGGLPMHSLFSPSDIPDYMFYSPDNCQMCKNGEKIDALCNAHGFTPL